MLTRITHLVPTRHAALLKLALISASALMLGGCTVFSKAVVDDNVPFYSTSVVIRPEKWRFANPRAGRAGIELAFDRQSGDGDQHIIGGQRIQLEDGNLNYLTFTGPQTLHYNATIRHGHVAYNHLLNFGSLFSLEPMGGLSLDRVQVQTLSLATAESQLTPRYIFGAAVGVVPRLHINRYLDAEVRVRATSDMSSYSTLVKPGVTFQPFNYVSVSAGYAWHRAVLKTTRHHDIANPFDPSDIALTFQGPSLSLQLYF